VTTRGILVLSRSQSLYEAARRVIPGGVNSPVRAFAGVGGTPLFMREGAGAWLTDEDGHRYIDYVGSWGPMILGHAHPEVVAAVKSAAERGLSFGTPTEAETRLAETICELMPSVESVRLVNSGTEATMTAVRLARGHTGRDKMLKFAGCYHGHVDALLVKAGSGALTLGLPGSPGIPESVTADTLVAPYNDLDAVTQAFDEHGDEIAGVIVEPVAGNMNCVPPVAGFLEGLRELTERHGSLLIFDEVMTGFRLSPGGAQAHYGITPDLTAMGKIVGGGMPVGALGGRRAVMETLAPTGPVYQAGTLAGNPVAMAAGQATLDALRHPGFHDDIAAKTRQISEALDAAAREAGVACTVHHVPGMFGLFFTEASAVRTQADVAACDGERFGRFFHAMLQRGVYLAPSAFETSFMSAAHGDNELERTATAAREAFRAL